FLRNFKIPYAILDGDARVMWINNSFGELTGIDKSYRKTVTAIFNELTKEVIGKVGEDPYSLMVNYNEGIYKATLQRLNFSEFEEANDPIVAGRDCLISLVLYDETELTRFRKENTDQKLVVALANIDNYDELIESVEDVKRAMLTAVIDRKVNRYFREFDAIVRKPERDKYFIIFRQKYLHQMEEAKFSILEEIKTTKMGNENEITLSIGVGARGENYTQTAEYARIALGLALGRGGSQAVVKNSDDISYYGLRGKEVERNTRVKARIKAQALRELMENRDQIIVMGHQISDIDAIGGGIGVYCAARELGKPCHIVLNTITSTLRPVLDALSPEAGYPRDMFVKSMEALELLNNTPNTLVMVVDTNRPHYTECPQLIDRCKNVVVIDHHRQDSDRITNPLLSYIEPYASSTCEMIAEVLQYFSDHVIVSPIEADCIYAGIIIDTNNFMAHTGVRTFEAAAYLRRCGAEVVRVRKMLREDMDTYKARAEVVRRTEVYKNAFAISVCEAGELESPTIVGAQAANELLNIIGIKASFVMTDYQNKIYISSRSIDVIDVQLIMSRLGGGGHLNIAGAQIEGATVDEVRQMIKDTLDAMLSEGEIKI
ncbi:MAG: DHH family phosphoesterase, partial [Lachnospiraceae bacterium]|nr:DHH family phosphoesterase [Lachnospiraceae bacterium]